MTAGRLDSPVRVLSAGRTLAQKVNRSAWIPNNNLGSLQEKLTIAHFPAFFHPDFIY
jgi:hypothetical protein